MYYKLMMMEPCEHIILQIPKRYFTKTTGKTNDYPDEQQQDVD